LQFEIRQLPFLALERSSRRAVLDDGTTQAFNQGIGKPTAEKPQFHEAVE
jgi:hypothetical protein